MNNFYCSKLPLIVQKVRLYHLYRLQALNYYLSVKLISHDHHQPRQSSANPTTCFFCQLIVFTRRDAIASHKCRASIDNALPRRPRESMNESMNESTKSFTINSHARSGKSSANPFVNVVTSCLSGLSFIKLTRLLTVSFSLLEGQVCGLNYLTWRYSNL